MSRNSQDDKFDRIVAVIVGQARLKSSFIYLANAVNDLRGNWNVVGLILAPLVLVAAVCLLPDAINLQDKLVHTFKPGTRSVGFVLVQSPMVPPAGPVHQTFSHWITIPLHIMLFLNIFIVNLVVLCALKRMQAHLRAATPAQEVIQVYRQALPMVPSFLLILLLRLLATVVGFVLLIIPGLLAFIWLYFSQYALVFDNLRSWPALLHSRDLMRGRFFKVATRIVVFLAVWSGYNSWVGGAFVAVSYLIGPIGYIAGSLWVAIFLIDLLAVAVAYTTIAFFLAAGTRLYQDLNGPSDDRAIRAAPVDFPTAPLTEMSA